MPQYSPNWHIATQNNPHTAYRRKRKQWRQTPGCPIIQRCILLSGKIERKKKPASLRPNTNKARK
jgi:hypothetical protein